MTQARRVSPRIPYDEAVCLVRTDQQGRLYGRGVDLGIGGLSLLAEEDCPIGVEIRCDLLLPHGPRPARGRVVRVTAAPGGFELAIAFVELKPSTVAAIAQLITERSAQAMPETEQHGPGTEMPLPSDGVPRLTLVTSPEDHRRASTQRYGAVRTSPARPPQPVRPPPTQLPPPYTSALPSIVVSPALTAELDATEEAPPPRGPSPRAGMPARRPAPDGVTRRPPIARTAVVPAAKHAVSPASFIPTARLTALEAPAWWPRAGWLALGLSAAVVLAAAIEHLGR